MYLIGEFNKDHFTGALNAILTKEITREHLAKAKQHDDYQVINLDDLTFFNPKHNAWEKIKNA